jgi:hypothetical protein
VNISSQINGIRDFIIDNNLMYIKFVQSSIILSNLVVMHISMLRPKGEVGGQAYLHHLMINFIPTATLSGIVISIMGRIRVI